MFVRLSLCLSSREMDGWGVGVFETSDTRYLKFGEGGGWLERTMARSITAGNCCYLAGINVDLRCLLI